MTQILLAISAIVNLLLLILLVRALVQLNDAQHLCDRLERDRDAYRDALQKKNNKKSQTSKQ